MTPEERNELVEQNMGLAVHFVQKYSATGMERDDLLQEAYLGLIDAAEGFDADRGVRFSTYAWWHIRKRITEALNKQNDMIRTPRRAKDRVQCLSLDYEYDHDLTMLDHLEDGSPEPWQELAEQERVDALHELIKELPDREGLIIRLRYGVNTEKMTLAKVAGVLGVTPERVRQLQRRAEKKLRTLIIQCAKMD